MKRKILSVMVCLAIVISMAGFTVYADAQSVADSISVDTITTETADLITADLNLPDEIDGLSVTWSSSDTDVITDAGVVMRHASLAKPVTMTASIDGGSATKDVALTVAPVTTNIIYQNNFSRNIKTGAAFDTTKEIIGTNDSTTQVRSWVMATANDSDKGTTLGATGGINIDFQSRANSPTYWPNVTLDSPFYVEFDIKTATVKDYVEFRLTFNGNIMGNTAMYRAFQFQNSSTTFRGDGNNFRTMSQLGGTNIGDTQTSKTKMRLYVDPVNLIVKAMDGAGVMRPAAGNYIGTGSLGDQTNVSVRSMNFARAGSTSPGGSIEIDNFAIYTVDLESVADGIDFYDLTGADADAVTGDLDFSDFKADFDASHTGISVSFEDNGDDAFVLDPDGVTGHITRSDEENVDTSVKVILTDTYAGTTYEKIIPFTVKVTPNEAEPIANGLYFDMFTGQSQWAVSEDLDFSEAEEYAEDNGATISFTSSNTDVLAIDGSTGVITGGAGSAKTDVTLTATVTKSGRNFSRNFSFYVLPADTYVIESEGFKYPDLEDLSIGSLDNWVDMDTNYGRSTYIDVKKDANGYYLESARTATTAGYGDTEANNITGQRKTSKLTVEMDVSAEEIGATDPAFDILFLGVKKDGTSVTDYAKYISKFRIERSGGLVRIAFNSDNTTRTTINVGETYKLRFEFDFINQWVDSYLNGVLKDEHRAWLNGWGDVEFSSISQIRFLSYRDGGNYKIDVDNLAVYSINPEYSDAAETVANGLYFDMFTGQSQWAVTNNLDFSEAQAYVAANGATISFTSSNDSVLSIDGSTGVITRGGGNAKTDVTLTATVTKGWSTCPKTFDLSVLPADTYLLESEGFKYPALVDQSVNSLADWTATGSWATSLKIKNNTGGYYLQSERTGTANGYNNEYNTLATHRPTENLTVEMDLSFDYLAGNPSGDIVFLGVKKDGTKVVDAAKRLVKLRYTNNALNVNERANMQISIAEGETHKVKLEFDFVNQGVSVYFDGVRKVNNLAWIDTSGDEYESLNRIQIYPYRLGENYKLGIDNLAVYSIDPEYTDTDVMLDARRPLQISTSLSNSNYYVVVQSDYNEDFYLKQQIEEKSEKFTQNPIVSFANAYLIDKSTGTNTTYTSSLKYNSSDESNPQIINGLYIGGNHGAKGARVTATAHGKTLADIGSVWEDENGIKFDLVRIEDENTLFFIEQKNYNLATTNFGFSGIVHGNLTYVSDGVNTGDITVSSSVVSQTYPSVANVKHTFYLIRDGVKEEFDNHIVGKIYKCDALEVVEEYDIINPCSIGAALRANKPAGGYTEAPSVGTGEPIFHYKQVITVNPDGTILTELDHEVLTNLKSYVNYGYQYYPRLDIFGGGAWRQVPGTKTFTDGNSVPFDISSPYKYTLVSGTDSTNLEVPQNKTLTSADWVDPNIVPSRMLDFFRDTQGHNVMGYMTGFLPIDMGAPATRKTVTNSNVYMYDAKVKAYPIFVSSSGASNAAALTTAGSVIKGVSYRKYVDLSGFETNNTQYYTVNYGDKTYFYVDFIDAGTQTIDLSDMGAVYDLTEEVEKIGDVSYVFNGDSITVTSTGKGYIILEATRKLDVESAYLEDGKYKAKFVNYSDTDEDVVIIVASYNSSGVLVGAEIAGTASIDAGKTVNESFSVSLPAGTSYKMFVWDGTDYITPVSKEKIIDIG